MRTKEDLEKLEIEVSRLFLKANIKTPKRILPNIVFDHMTAEDCFKTRMRTLLSNMNIRTNFKISDEGKIITDISGEEPIIVINNTERANKIKDEIKKKLNIDINKI